MDPWTAERRNEFIQNAVNSKDTHGKSGPYHYNLYPKQETNNDDDPKRSLVTETLASCIYKSSARKLSLNFYSLLMNKMMCHPMLSHEINRNIVVIMKGSNSHSYMIDFTKNNDVFKFSDLDISVYINPNLSDEMFYSIKKQCEIIVKQAISQYKRTLDHMLFLGSNDLSQSFMSIEEINEFKNSYKNTMNNMSFDESQECEQFFTPFDSIEIRNKCSRNSFLLTNSKVVENSVVMVEVPHFDMCERIPLRKTPLFCSFNETIDFLRDGNDKIGRFNLYRLRMNNILAKFNEDGSVLKEEKVVADFIDVSVLDKGDAELDFFWNHGRSINVYDPIVGFWLMIPDLHTSITELERILSIYSSCSGKKEKRMKKLEILKNII